MKVVVSMLRGVNVGHHKRVMMQPLRQLYQSLGLRDPQTYIQSGNVVFKTSERNLASLRKRIEDGIEHTFGFQSAVILRTPAELRDAIAKNPFATRSALDPSRLLITFLSATPSPEACKKVLSIKVGPEELRVGGRELYVYYPEGMGRSKLTPAMIEKALGTPGTARNLNSVLKLLEMAEQMESSP